MNPMNDMCNGFTDMVYSDLAPGTWEDVYKGVTAHLLGAIWRSGQQQIFWILE
jgi:hypothetical protein